MLVNPYGEIVRHPGDIITNRPFGIFPSGAPLVFRREEFGMPAKC